MRTIILAICLFACSINGRSQQAHLSCSSEVDDIRLALTIKNDSSKKIYIQSSKSTYKVCIQLWSGGDGMELLGEHWANIEKIKEFAIYERREISPHSQITITWLLSEMVRVGGADNGTKQWMKDTANLAVTAVAKMVYFVVQEKEKDMRMLVFSNEIELDIPDWKTEGGRPRNVDKS